MPNRNESQGDRQPKQANDRRQDQLRSPTRQQEQQGERIADFPGVHPLLLQASLPNRPAGRINSTMTMTMNTTVAESSG